MSSDQVIGLAHLPWGSRDRSPGEAWWDKKAGWRKHEPALLRVLWFPRMGWESRQKRNDTGRGSHKLAGDYCRLECDTVARYGSSALEDVFRFLREIPWS